jgi:hypothetical protein
MILSSVVTVSKRSYATRQRKIGTTATIGLDLVFGLIGSFHLLKAGTSCHELHFGEEADNHVFKVDQ